MRRLSRIALALVASATAALGQPSKLSETVNVHVVEVPVTLTGPRMLVQPVAPGEQTWVWK